MYYMFTFKSGLKKKILVNICMVDLLNEIYQIQEEGKHFIILNYEIINIDEIEHIEGLRGG
jgi:hypothetical protein